MRGPAAAGSLLRSPPGGGARCWQPGQPGDVIGCRDGRAGAGSDRDRHQAGISPADRRPGPLHRRYRPGRGPRAGRRRRGAGAVAGRGRAAQPRRLADDRRQAARHRLSSAATASWQKKYAQIGRALEPRTRCTPDFDQAFSDDIDDDLLRLIFTACHPVLCSPGQGRADAPAARRPDDRRDRTCLPGPGADHRAAHRPGQEDAGAARTCRSRCPAADQRPARLVLGARSHLPHLQRGLLGDRRR